MSAEDKIKLLKLQIDYLKETRDNRFLIKGIMDDSSSDTTEHEHSPETEDPICV